MGVQNAVALLVVRAVRVGVVVGLLVGRGGIDARIVVIALRIRTSTGDGVGLAGRASVAVARGYASGCLWVGLALG